MWKKNGPKTRKLCKSDKDGRVSSRLLTSTFPSPSCSFGFFSTRRSSNLVSTERYRCVELELERVVVVVVGVGVERQPWCKQQPITCLGDDSPLLAGAHVRRQHICCEDEEHASAGMLLTAPTHRSSQMVCTCYTGSYWNYFILEVFSCANNKKIHLTYRTSLIQDNHVL